MPKAGDINMRDGSPNARRIGPYEKKALDASKELLEAAIEEQAAGRDYRDVLDAVLATHESQETLQIEPDVVIRPGDTPEEGEALPGPFLRRLQVWDGLGQLAGGRGDG